MVENKLIRSFLEIIGSLKLLWNLDLLLRQTPNNNCWGLSQPKSKVHKLAETRRRHGRSHVSKSEKLACKF